MISIPITEWIERVKPSFDDKALSYLAGVLYDEFIQTGEESRDFETLRLFIAYNWFNKNLDQAKHWMRLQLSMG